MTELMKLLAEMKDALARAGSEEKNDTPEKANAAACEELTAGGDQVDREDADAGTEAEKQYGCRVGRIGIDIGNPDTLPSFICPNEVVERALHSLLRMHVYFEMERDRIWEEMEKRIAERKAAEQNLLNRIVDEIQREYANLHWLRNCRVYPREEGGQAHDGMLLRASSGQAAADVPGTPAGTSGSGALFHAAVHGRIRVRAPRRATARAMRTGGPGAFTAASWRLRRDRASRVERRGEFAADPGNTLRSAEVDGPEPAGEEADGTDDACAASAQSEGERKRPAEAQAHGSEASAKRSGPVLGGMRRHGHSKTAR